MRDAVLPVIEELFDDKICGCYLFRGPCACGLVGCSICIGRGNGRAMGTDAGGTRYSAARQIDRSKRCAIADRLDLSHRAMEQDTKLIRKSAFEATPILVENKLFLSTPYGRVIALNPQNGTKVWEYDPAINLSQNYSEVTSRGVSAWRDPEAKPGQACSLRIFMGTIDGRLIAIDGETGKACMDFGSKGEVDLTRDAATATDWTGGYQVTSAPAIAKDFGDYGIVDCG